MIQLSNSLIALTKEKDISLGVDMIPFKIINCNRAAEYIYVSHKRYISDKKTDEIVKSLYLISTTSADIFINHISCFI